MKKTTEQFKEELKVIMPNVNVIGEYINMGTAIRCLCLEHNYEFSSMPGNLLKGHTGCKKCASEKQSKTQTKSHEKFVEQMANINPDIEIIGRYINNETHVLCKCKIDGHQWNADPKRLLKGSKCPVCQNKVVMPGVNDIATTHPDFVIYFKNKEEATKYVAGSEAYIDVICPICGTEKRIRIANLVRFGFACNGCYEKKHGHKRVSYNYWNIETMQQYLDEHKPGYTILDSKVESSATGNRIYVYIKCPDENHEPYWAYWAYWTNIQRGYSCKKCYYEMCNKTEWDSERAYNFVASNGFIMLDRNDFKNVNKSFPCKDKDGYIYMININNLNKYINGDRTFFSLLQYNPYAIYNIKQHCKLNRPDYDIISTEYIGSHSLHTFIYNGDFDDCKEHNRIFTTTVGNFLFGNVGHPDLTISHGEKKAKDLFTKHNIEFKPQHKWSDCRDKQVLPFDFYLPEYNLVVEIMGEQHEHPVTIFGGEEKFQETLYHDKIKRNYLKAHGIPILDIWYYEFNNMEKIILDKIKSLKNNNPLKEEPA